MSKKKKNEKQTIICKCYNVTKEDMKDFIKNGNTNFKEFKKETKIGKCSSCKKKNKKRFEKYVHKMNTELVEH